MSFAEASGPTTIALRLVRHALPTRRGRARRTAGVFLPRSGSLRLAPALDRSVASGEADAAAIASNALRLAMRRDPALGGRLRVIESWGPRPIQPLLARAGIPADLKARILAALLSMHEDPPARCCLETFGVLRFTRVAESDYAMLQVPRT